jgi:hypothetical protein
VLAGIVDNEIYIKKESVRRFEIGRDKKKTTRTSVSHAEEREREKGSCSIHVDVLLEIFFLLLLLVYFFATLKTSSTKEKPGT